MSTVMSNLIDSIGQFFSGIGDIITDDFIPLLSEPSGVMLTFVVAFPLCFLGVWLIKKIIRVKDTD